MEMQKQITKDFNSLNVVVDNLLDDGTFYKNQNTIYCSSLVGYSFCFLNGIDELSIAAAGNIAKQVVRDKIDSLTLKTTWKAKS